jgi:hypothetical protein
MLDERKERNILKLILIVRFACAILDVGHPIPWISAEKSADKQLTVIFAESSFADVHKEPIYEPLGGRFREFALNC